MKAPHVSGDQIASLSRTSTAVQVCVACTHPLPSSWKCCRFSLHRVSSTVEWVTPGGVKIDNFVSPHKPTSLSLPSSSKIWDLHYFFPPLDYTVAKKNQKKKKKKKKKPCALAAQVKGHAFFLFRPTSFPVRQTCSWPRHLWTRTSFLFHFTQNCLLGLQLQQNSAE